VNTDCNALLSFYPPAFSARFFTIAPPPFIPHVLRLSLMLSKPSPPLFSLVFLEFSGTIFSWGVGVSVKPKNPHQITGIFPICSYPKENSIPSEVTPVYSTSTTTRHDPFFPFPQGCPILLGRINKNYYQTSVVGETLFQLPPYHRYMSRAIVFGEDKPSPFWAFSPRHKRQSAQYQVPLIAIEMVPLRVAFPTLFSVPLLLLYEVPETHSMRKAAL